MHAVLSHAAVLSSSLRRVFESIQKDGVITRKEVVDVFVTRGLNLARDARLAAVHAQLIKEPEVGG
jgi:hypothetical protein